MYRVWCLWFNQSRGLWVVKKKKQNKFSRFIWNSGTRKQRFLFFYLSQRLFCPKNRELCHVECTRRARKTYALFRANSLVILKAVFGSYQTFRLLAKNGYSERVFSEKKIEINICPESSFFHSTTRD